MTQPIPYNLPVYREDASSQVPALFLLARMGYEYLSPRQALALRGGRVTNVLLEGILTEWLRSHNCVRYKGQELPFTEGNIQEAVQALKSVPVDGLVRTNEKVYDLLTLGKSLPQSVDGELKSFSLQYIDWKHPENNVFHVTEEFDVGRSPQPDPRLVDSQEDLFAALKYSSYRPDLVLFVNGIPLAVIECKRPDLVAAKNERPLDQAISQQIRNQKEEGIPSLYIYSQLLLGLAVNDAYYGTVGTPARFWSRWREEEVSETEITELLRRPVPMGFEETVLEGRAPEVREQCAGEEARLVTEQDKMLVALCRPDRLLEMAFNYVLFDAGTKKIARYQQYFCVKHALDRIKQINPQGERAGGVVWHTQGSGKSLTMVMLAKAIALLSLPDYKIILVTDRDDLDRQIFGTFHSCGIEVERVPTGRALMEMIVEKKQRVITTIIDKFEAAIRIPTVNESPNIFILVDESHRTQYGSRHAKMKKVLPNASYVGFTGTPLLKGERRNTLTKFGNLIGSPYTMRKAVDDNAVVPLLYEGREPQLFVNKKPLDVGFDRITDNLTDEQKHDIKRKYERWGAILRSSGFISAVAGDVSDHFEKNWKDTGFKAQLVAPSKTAAIAYHKALNEIGKVTSQVFISPPDDREGEEDVEEETTDEVKVFWNAQMRKYGGEAEYNKQVISAFKQSDEPEIVIVVSKLLTGFDSPKNTVLYVAKQMKEQNLLQGIARVNRLAEGKDYGYIIDYANISANLNTALDLYSALPNIDPEFLDGTMSDISQEIARLPGAHTALWDLFKFVKNRKDAEAFERALELAGARLDFQERLTLFARLLAVALSSDKFIKTEPAEAIEKYKADMKFFLNLLRSASLRYSMEINFHDYEKRVQKLVNTHVGAGEVDLVVPLVNIFEQDEFKKQVEKEAKTKAGQAHMIASRTQKTISEKMAQDPAFYRKFSDVLEQALRDFHEERINDSEFLLKVCDVQDAVLHRTGDELPKDVKDRTQARAYFGILREECSGKASSKSIKEFTVQAALEIEQKFAPKVGIVNWQLNQDVQNQMRIEIDDVLCDLKARFSLELDWNEVDRIIERCLLTAKAQSAAAIKR